MISACTDVLPTQIVNKISGNVTNEQTTVISKVNDREPLKIQPICHAGLTYETDK